MQVYLEKMPFKVNERANASPCPCFEKEPGSSHLISSNAPPLNNLDIQHSIANVSYKIRSLRNLALRFNLPSAITICPPEHFVPSATGIQVTVISLVQVPICLPSGEQMEAPAEVQDPVDDPAAPDPVEPPLVEPELEGADGAGAGAELLPLPPPVEPELEPEPEPEELP